MKTGGMRQDRRQQSGEKPQPQGSFYIVLRGSILALICIVLLVTLPQLTIKRAQTREKVRVALGSISVNTSVIPVGHQYGLFAKYGVDLEPIYMGGGMNSLAAVTSNWVQFLSAGSTATISARLGGMDITMLNRPIEQARIQHLSRAGNQNPARLERQDRHRDAPRRVG